MKRNIALGSVAALVVVFAVLYVATEKAASAKKASSLDNTVAGESTLSGKVVETMNAGGYTYVNIIKDGKKTWVAVPETKVSVGQMVNFSPGHEMPGFTSKTLNRTFDSIIFSGGLLSGAEAEGENKPASEKQVSGRSATKTTGKISVAKASGPNAYTIGEVFSKKAKLNNKKAVIQAKVVKVSAGIMGKNWIHLQDGTGDAGTGTNDLIATSQDLPAVGDVVTVKGTIYKDKDFGSGYKYDVIMEQASVQR